MCMTLPQILGTSYPSNYHMLLIALTYRGDLQGQVINPLSTAMQGGHQLAIRTNRCRKVTDKVDGGHILSGGMHGFKGEPLPPQM